MRLKTITALAASSCMLTACSTDQPGPLGLNRILFGRSNLALVDPLFGKQERRCFDRPDQLLTVLDSSGKPEARLYASEDSHPGRAKKCQAIAMEVRKTLLPDNVPTIPPGGTLQRVVRDDSGQMVSNTVQAAQADPEDPVAAQGSQLRYDQHRRNEIIDALIATSNRKCASYTAFIKNTDSVTNAGLSIAAIVAGGVGPVAGGEATAKALAATSAIFSGARASINEAFLSNQTIQVLAAAYEKVRQKQRAEISNREACGIDTYSLMRGAEDAWQYHESCSLVVGLEETAAAVQRSDNPGIKEMTAMLEQVAKLHKAIGDAATGTSSNGDTGTTTTGVAGTTGTPAAVVPPTDAASPVTPDDISKANDALKKATDDLTKAKAEQAKDLDKANKAAKGSADLKSAQTAYGKATIDVGDKLKAVTQAKQNLDALKALQAANAPITSEKPTCPFN